MNLCDTRLLVERVALKGFKICLDAEIKNFSIIRSKKNNILQFCPGNIVVKDSLIKLIMLTHYGAAHWAID